jgi:hypothetical protein
MEDISGTSKSLCPQCRQFYDAKTGRKIPSLSHITVSIIEEKHLCRDCAEEREAWGANGPEAT